MSAPRTRIAPAGISVFALALALGAAIRLFLAITSINFGDLYIYGTTVEAGGQHLPLYHDTLFTYPPLWGYYFEGLGRVFAILGIKVFQHVDALIPYSIRTLVTPNILPPVALFFIKLPALICDAIATFLAYRLAGRLAGPVASRIAAASVWLNPMAIFASAVQASWDSIITAAVLATTLCMYSEEFAGAGAWIAFGVMSKLVTLYNLPVALCAAISSGKVLSRVKKAIGLSLGFVLVVGISLWPILQWHEFQLLYGSIFARTSLFSVGGANLWSVAAIYPFQGLGIWAEQHQAVVAYASLMLHGSAVAFACVIAFRRPHSLPALTGANALVLGAQLVTSPFVQPNYSLWVAPLAIVLGAKRNVWLFRMGWAHGIVTFLYIATIRLPQILLAPGCYYFRLCDLAEAARQNFFYNTMPGHLSGLFQVDVDAILGEIAAIIALFIIVLLVRECLAKDRAAADA